MSFIGTYGAGQLIDQENIHKQCISKNPEECIEGLKQLKSNFPLLPDKEKAWNDLHELTTNINSWIRYYAATTLISVYSQVPDKQQAWKDIIKLITEDWAVRVNRSYFLFYVFQDVPDKSQAWQDLHRFTTSRNSFLRYIMSFSIGAIFSDIPDKNQSWEDLHILTEDAEAYIRVGATVSLGSAFYYIPDKEQAWNDLHRLTEDEIINVRSEVVSSIKLAFPHIPYKYLAWNDLIKLTEDKDWVVSWNAASSLGSVFPYVSDKDQAWNDLRNLAKNENTDVGKHVNNSLGKTCVFKASQAENEEDYKKELENAILFFEKASSQEAKWNNPSEFCLPFYRSFHTIIFKRQKSEEEVEKYLAEAKAAVKGSKSKELLFEAVENLANALKEVQNIENLNLEAKKGELNFYRQYCDRAAELMIDTEKIAPFAAIAVRKGLPILDRNLKELLEEIQKKAKIACKEAKGTVTEEIACIINKEIQTWEIGSQEEMASNVENLIFTLESNVPRIPANQYIFNRIQQIREQKDVSKQYGIISTIIPLIPKLYMEQTVGELKNDIKEIKETVDYAIISLKPGIKEEIEISVGTEILGTGVTHKITIPLQEISYSELKDDLEKMTGIKIDKLSKVSKRLANKIKGYLLLHDKEDVLEKLI